MPKRKWSGAPAWADYLAQLLYAIDYKISSIGSWFSYRAGELLDSFCRCEKCLKRRLTNP